ncbi:MAG: hypothetical protein PF445_08930 [Melioribacteraceae bacterium]|jgi:hypothetical protein|nr:hypothetical protein [Melioribacteraceae bacterium]
MELNIDTNKNLLFVSIIGTVSNNDLIAGVGKAGELLPQLKEDLSIIMNLTEFKQTSTDQIALFNKIIKSIDDKIKINLVIRIMGESKSLIPNFCKMDKLFKMDNVRYVPTMEDAIKLIDGEDCAIEACP